MITVLFAGENVVLQADRSGNAIFFDADGNELLWVIGSLIIGLIIMPFLRDSVKDIPFELFVLLGMVAELALRRFIHDRSCGNYLIITAFTIENREK